ncbi:MAG: hypothetical protein ACRC33_14070 [Gemmataceae bacterium]
MTINDEPPDARMLAGLDAHRRNSDWLDSHWGDFLPQARGRFVVVAGCQGAVVESTADALRWLADHHPDDPGPIVKYVHLDDGPRIYAHRG